MKKRFVRSKLAAAGRRLGSCLPVLLCVLCLAAGCSLGAGEERTPLDFTVVESGEVPEELAQVIEEHREEEMQIAFTDDGGLYVVRGYGKQDTGGYSIMVDECSEGEDSIYVATTLVGPSQTDKISQEPSYPVIVIKIENREKEVVFE